MQKLIKGACILEIIYYKYIQLLSVFRGPMTLHALRGTFFCDYNLKCGVSLRDAPLCVVNDAKKIFSVCCKKILPIKLGDQ